MDLDTRIRRRMQRDREPQLVIDFDALSPVAHLEEPVGRGPTLERLLDYVQPSFDGALPDNAYLWGPPGAGKSAVVTALFSKLDGLLTQTGTIMHTATRAQARESPSVAYVDARRADSPFKFYHAILSALIDDRVPEQGISTERLRERIGEVTGGARHALVAVDHVEEHGSIPLSSVATWLEPVDEAVSWLAIGRDPPSALDSDAVPTERVEVPGYERQVIVDLLMTRASNGLARHGIEHDQARRLAEWADGNAHDALAALFSAALTATDRGHTQLRDDDVKEGMNAVPLPCVALGRLLALPVNRQRVLRELLATDPTERQSVTAAAEAVVAAPGIDLSVGTVKRYLYELAESGIVERVTTESESAGKGRPPSRVVPRFPTLVFEHIYDQRND